MIKKMAMLLMVSFLLVGCSEVEYERTKVIGVVSYKEHKKSWVQVIPTGKVTTSVYHPARYNVGVRYEGVETTFDDKRMYETMNVGDEVEVNLVRKIDTKTGKQLKSFLALME